MDVGIAPAAALSPLRPSPFVISSDEESVIPGELPLYFVSRVYLDRLI
jgi:hypothetical protein